MTKRKTKLQIHLVLGDIAKAGDVVSADSYGLPPIDAIAVGHYIGVPPVRAELAIDKAISRASFGPNSRRLLITVSQGGTSFAVTRGDLSFCLTPARPTG